MFVKLGKMNGSYIYVNPLNIVSIYSLGGLTQIKTNDGDTFTVPDSIDKVVSVVEEYIKK